MQRFIFFSEKRNVGMDVFFLPPRLSGPLDRWFDTSTIVHVKALSVGDICKLYIMQQSTSVINKLTKIHEIWIKQQQNIIHHMLINSGWFPTRLKNMSQTGFMFPNFRDENKKIFELPSPRVIIPETTPLKDLFCTLPLRGFAPAGAYNWNEWRDLSHWKNLNYSQVVNHPNISNISKMHQILPELVSFTLGIYVKYIEIPCCYTWETSISICLRGGLARRAAIDATSVEVESLWGAK